MNTTETVSAATLLRRKKRQQERNEAFQKLTKAEQRVEIAKDVILALASRKLIAEAGTYLDEENRFLVDFDDQPISEVIKGGGRCNVCALGALFVAGVKNDDTPVCEVGYISPGFCYGDKPHFSPTADRLRAHLKKYFSHTQLAMIENAFERDNSVWNTTNTHSVGGANFAKDVESDSKRMKLIMQNIIDNDGTFKPNAEKVTRRKPAPKKTALKKTALKKNARLGRN